MNTNEETTQEPKKRMTEKQGQQGAVFKFVTALLLVVCTGAMGWTGSNIIAHERELSEIRASRFTAKDGLEIWKELAAIKEAVSKQTLSPPPQWFVDKVARVEAKQDEADRKMAELREVIHENALQLRMVIDRIPK